MRSSESWSRELPPIKDDSQATATSRDDLAERRRRRSGATPPGRALSHARPRPQTPSVSASLGLEDLGDEADADAVLDALADIGRDDGGAATAPSSECVEEDVIGERLRHHHERSVPRASDAAAPRGSAELGNPARAPTPQRLRAPAALLAPSAAWPAKTRTRSLLTKPRAPRHVLLVAAAFAVLGAVVVAVVIHGGRSASPANSTGDAPTLGEFTALRRALTTADQGVVLDAREAAAAEQRITAARHARAERRETVKQRAARRRRLEHRSAGASAHHATLTVAGSPSTTDPGTGTTVNSPTQTSSSSAPSQTTSQSTSPTSSSASSSSGGQPTQTTRTYGEGGILGAGHQG